MATGRVPIAKILELWMTHEFKEKEYYEYYQTISKELKGTEYCAKDVTEFCKHLGRLLQGDESSRRKGGLFISALINHGADKDYELDLTGLKPSLSGIGYKNQKNIRIRGSVDERCGEDMQTGRIFITENATGSIGTVMKDGEIHILGDAITPGGSGIGMSKRDGSITVYGNANGIIGTSMAGGKITICGNAVSANIGELMVGGQIRIKKNASGDIANSMRGGEIIIDGDATIWNLATSLLPGEGRIYLNGKVRLCRWQQISCADIYLSDILLVENGQRLDMLRPNV
jgi:formylmethanofuran dehydrogenase subunit C